MKALRIVALILAVMMLTGCGASGCEDKNISSSGSRETMVTSETTTMAGTASADGEKGDGLKSGNPETTSQSDKVVSGDAKEIGQTENTTVSDGGNSGKGKQNHNHSYSRAVTKEATCGAAGLATYTCSCGESYTETIPATGNHSWKEITEIIHHDAVTEQVWIVDKAAWDETVTEEVPVYDQRLVIVATCRGCGGQFSGYDQDEVLEIVSEHIYNVHGNSCGYGFEASYWEEYQTGTEEVTRTVHHNEEGHYETKIKEKAWDETVIRGYKCTVCGEEK